MKLLDRAAAVVDPDLAANRCREPQGYEMRLWRLTSTAIEAYKGEKNSLENRNENGRAGGPAIEFGGSCVVYLGLSEEINYEESNLHGTGTRVRFDFELWPSPGTGDGPDQWPSPGR